VKNTLLIGAAVALVIGAGLVLGILLLGDGNGDAGATPTPGPGTIFEPPLDVDDFTLTGHTGEPLSLSDLRGQVVVLYFGYTSCPDVCPVSLATLVQIKRRIDPALYDELAVVFVSVDGERDTPERLALYLRGFDPAFMGMTGSENAVSKAATLFGVTYGRRYVEGSQAGYLVSHTSKFFVIGPDGRWRMVFPDDADPAYIADQITPVLRAAQS
jgi:protein SCO1